VLTLVDGGWEVGGCEIFRRDSSIPRGFIHS